MDSSAFSCFGSCVIGGGAANAKRDLQNLLEDAQAKSSARTVAELWEDEVEKTSGVSPLQARVHDN